MIMYKCKNCGGDLSGVKDADTNIVTCEYCDSIMTIPTADDEKKVNLFNRANQYRMNKDFDKAIAVYNTILNEYPTEPEAYFGMVLCKYGIEYVDDPKTQTKIPTCHRTIVKSIFEDADYNSAIKNADTYAAEIYASNAAQIDKIQKEILMVSKNEKPFDVFICYKESNEITGERTEDSVRAEYLYNKLTNEGLRVFFSRITLEDKLGEKYEPYIFSALTTAKVMIVIGSKAEYFNAVWVKNEWSRFLDMMKNDNGKLIIPAYFNMDPYDIPMELSAMQAQNMEKMGFEQDLLRVIKKNISTKIEKTVSSENAKNGYEPLLERGYLFFEEQDYDKAYEYFEMVLDKNPRECRAYWGKLLLRLELESDEEICCENVANNIMEEFSFTMNKDTTDEDIDEEIDILINNLLGTEYKYAVQFAQGSDLKYYKDCYDKLREIVAKKAATKKEMDIIDIENRQKQWELEAKRMKEAQEKRRQQEEEERIKREAEEIRQKRLSKIYSCIVYALQVLFFAYDYISHKDGYMGVGITVGNSIKLLIFGCYIVVLVCKVIHFIFFKFLKLTTKGPCGWPITLAYFIYLIIVNRISLGYFNIWRIIGLGFICYFGLGGEVLLCEFGYSKETQEGWTKKVENNKEEKAN